LGVSLFAWWLGALSVTGDSGKISVMPTSIAALRYLFNGAFISPTAAC
jgi:hypothetical protein